MKKVINTVSTIFKERYGTYLKIEKAKQHNKLAQPLFLSHWQSPFVYSRTLRQVSFPIFNSKKELQAIATASPVENKDAVVFDEMAQFLQLTIAEHIELQETKELQIKRAIAAERVEADTSKVIELKTKKTGNQPQSFQFKRQPTPREFSDQPIWISGDNQNFNAHMAFSIHDWISNWAFINAKEIPDLVWQDPNAWQNFPQVTLFIPNIESLSEENLNTLRKNLQTLSKIKENKPFIIVSSQTSVSPQLELLKRQFRHYQAKDSVSARVQAHYLLFHYKESKTWTYQCEDSKSIFFLPFSSSPKHFH